MGVWEAVLDIARSLPEHVMSYNVIIIIRCLLCLKELNDEGAAY